MLEHCNINLKSNDYNYKYYESAIRKRKEHTTNLPKEYCRFNDDSRANKAIE